PPDVHAQHRGGVVAQAEDVEAGAERDGRPDRVNVPLAVWILEGFMSGIPREIDETAAIDGYSLPRFFVRIFLPMIRSALGVTAFFCFMFSWVELLIARTITSVDAKPIAATMTRTVSAAGVDWGLLAAAGVLTIVPGAVVIWFVRNYIAKGFALGRV
ncbi:carbohydrate ABC transporter permease, partial [Nonomuraea sp. NPDC001023]|uniref:carbohydrate ABC transporter permease n=1 Tax=Nonomuraea sp. NPDC001023 TaxID=3154770 RepID=UPI003321D2FD